MKLVIFGSRNITEYEDLEPIICTVIQDNFSDVTEIVSGCARGADTLGEQFAADYQLPVKKFPADWEKYGKAAGPIRNADMAAYADAGIALWDGESRGTLNMIDQMHKLGKQVVVIQRYD